MPFIVAQISDPHLGARTPLFRDNFARVVRTLEQVRPELVIATGDVSLDGADREDDLAYAAESFAALPAAVHAVPGNHDVGDHPERAPLQPVSDMRLDRFRRTMGRDRWVIDRENWRLLGLNSQVMGAHPDEADQAAMIEAALADLGERRLAVFIHKPFFAADPAETLFDYWSVPPFARAPLRPIMAHPNLRLVASGHLHLHRETTLGRVRYAWAPAVSFIVAPDEQPDLPGDRPCGVLLHRFAADDVGTELLVPPGMERPYIHEVRDEAYPAAVV
ncbi:MAG: metallophosphoesterase [Acetobacteraceae bacterium]